MPRAGDEHQPNPRFNLNLQPTTCKPPQQREKPTSSFMAYIKGESRSQGTLFPLVLEAPCIKPSNKEYCNQCPIWLLVAPADSTNSNEEK